MLGSVVFMWPLNNQSPRPPDSKQVGFAKELIDFRDETTLLETLIFKMSFQVLFDWAPVKRLLTFIGARTVTNWDVVEYCKLNIIVELYDAYISASAFAGKLHFQWDLMELQRWNTQRFFDAIVKVFPFSHPWCVGIWFPLTDLVSQGFGLHCPGFPACVAHWTWSSCEKPLRGQSCWDWETGWIYNYMLGYYGSDCTYLCLIIIQCSFIMFYHADRIQPKLVELVSEVICHSNWWLSNQSCDHVIQRPFDEILVFASLDKGHANCEPYRWACVTRFSTCISSWKMNCMWANEHPWSHDFAGSHVLAITSCSPIPEPILPLSQECNQFGAQDDRQEGSPPGSNLA